MVCTSPPPESLTGFPSRITRQIDGQSYGMELLVRKQAGRFTGWIAYTLSRTERIYSCGLRPADYDQTHVLNVVVQVRLPWNLMVGARLLIQTGRPVTMLDAQRPARRPRATTRACPTTSSSTSASTASGSSSAGRSAVFLEVVNLTYSESIIGITYPTSRIRSTPAGTSRATTATVERVQLDPAVDRRARKILMRRLVLHALAASRGCSYTFDSTRADAALRRRRRPTRRRCRG